VTHEGFARSHLKLCDPNQRLTGLPYSAQWLSGIKARDQVLPRAFSGGETHP